MHKTGDFYFRSKTAEYLDASRRFGSFFTSECGKVRWSAENDSFSPSPELAPGVRLWECLLVASIRGIWLDERLARSVSPSVRCRTECWAPSWHGNGLSQHCRQNAIRRACSRPRRRRRQNRAEIETERDREGDEQLNELLLQSAQDDPLSDCRRSPRTVCSSNVYLTTNRPRLGISGLEALKRTTVLAGM